MSGNKALFEGLVFDENEQPVRVVQVGNEPFYVVDDNGFLRHIPANDVDKQVLDSMISVVKENEDLFAEQTAKMLGQEDIFTKAIIQNQLKNMDKQVDNLFQTGIPEEGRAYMGMMGFKVTINLHGEVVRIDQPHASLDEDEPD